MGEHEQPTAAPQRAVKHNALVVESEPEQRFAELATPELHVNRLGEPVDVKPSRSARPQRKDDFVDLGKQAGGQRMSCGRRHYVPKVP